MELPRHCRLPFTARGSAIPRRRKPLRVPLRLVYGDLAAAGSVFPNSSIESKKVEFLEKANEGFVLGPGNSSYVECTESERQVLLTFKEGIDDFGGILSSWNKSGEQDCCKWSGVGCDNQTGHVVLLDLRPGSSFHWRMLGVVGSSLLELPYLTYLDLSGNSIYSIFPNYTGSHHKLTYLNLSSNWLRAPFPYQLGNLSNLQYLDLSHNFRMNVTVDNFDWLNRLSSLRVLKLCNVDFAKAVGWFQSIKTHPSLSTLEFTGCKFPKINLSYFSFLNSSKSLVVLRLISNTFNNPIYLWLSNLSTALVEILIIDNQLIGPIPDYFGGFTSLEHLNLSFNQIEGALPTSFRNLCNLKILDLSANNMSGSFDENLLNLRCSNKSLEILSLSRNQLGGSIPDYISEFEPLRVLNIDHNILDGSFPETLKQLPKLVTLNVEGNQLVGSFPNLEMFPSLVEFRAANNKLSGSFNESIGQLSNLTVFDISSNLINGVSKVFLSSLSKLQKLDLSDNSLALNVSSDWVPSFQLDTLKLRNCKLGSQFPSWLQTQKNISYLDISSCGISDAIPNWFWNFSSPLRCFNLSYNHIYGQIPNLPVDYSMWPTVDLSSNLLHGPIPPFLSLTAALILSKNKFSGSLSDFLCTNNYGMLSLLDLSDNLLSGGLSDCWIHYSEMIILNLENNRLSGAIPSSMSGLSIIRTLRLRNNNLTGKLPASLMNCGALKILDVGDNRLTDELPAWIGENLTDLVVLRLRSNEFHGKIPSTLCHLSSLQVLDLSFNDLSGAIPTCLNNLSAMVSTRSLDKTISYKYTSDYEFLTRGSLREFSTYFDFASIFWKGVEQEYGKTLGLLKVIDLSSNNLIGGIPSEVTRMSGLISLNVSRNSLVGAIPVEIGELKLLDVLDLSHNQLAGHIPPSLADISFLSKLDLSHNKLTGRIPTDTQLQSFGPTPYLDNPGLCGCPLPTKCPGGRIECLNSRRNEDPPTADSTETETEEDHGEFVDRSSLYAGMGAGFAAGFWGFCGLLIISKSWRITYLKFLSDMGDWLYVVIALKVAKRGYRAGR